MARNGFKIMDSDMHVIEPWDLWLRYMEPAYRDRAPIGIHDHPRDLGVTLDGKPLTSGPPATPESAEGSARERADQTPQYRDGDEHEFDSGSQVRAMDVEGLDTAVLFPTRALFTHNVDGMAPDLGDAVGRAYDNWMYDFCQQDPARLHGSGAINPHDVELGVQEIRRCVTELGFKAMFLKPVLHNRRNWYDPYYDPFWAECERLGVPVGFHDGSRSPFAAPEVQMGGHFHSTMLQHASGWHAMQMMMAATAFCAGGILEKFPDLKVAFLEGNCAWVPWLMWRLDEHQEWRGFEAPELKMRPSEYFKRQCYVSIECDEAPARFMDALGYGDNIVFSTDYPHPDSKFPHAVDSFFELDFPEDARRRYLWDNCARLYGFA